MPGLGGGRRWRIALPRRCARRREPLGGRQPEREESEARGEGKEGSALERAAEHAPHPPHAQTSSLHKDHYENLYAVIRGRKEFTLLPPLALPGLRERVYVCARYAWREHVPAQIPPAGGGEGSPSSDAAVSRGAAEGSATADGARTGTWAVEIDRDEAGRPRRVPWVSVNPCAAPDSCPPAYAAVARHARTVTLGPGDLLYLPALWYHQVGQGPAGGGHGEEEEEGLTIAVNAWFDMAFDGPAYAYYVALRAALGLA